MSAKPKVTRKITVAVIVSRMNDAVERLDGEGHGLVANDLAAARDELARGTFVKAEDLMGVADLAAFFDVGATTVSGWYMNRHRTNMPEPVAWISNKIPCWDGYAVVDWWTSWVPRKGAKAGTLPWERTPIDTGEAV